MFTSLPLKHHLKSISLVGSGTENAEIDYFEFTPNVEYKALIAVRICVDCRCSDKYYDWYTTEWIKKFSTFTGTTWTLAPKFPRINTKYIRTYKCLNSSHSCKSRIVFKVIGHNLNSSKIIITLNCYCRKDRIKNHLSVEAKQTISGKYKSADEKLLNVQHIFFTYFSDSFTPTTAIMYHNLIHLINKFEKENILSDQTINPTMNDVRSFWRTWKCLQDRGAKKFKICIEEILERKKVEMDKMGVLIRTENQEMIVLITPTMKRVLACHELNVIIVNSTAVPGGPQVTVFFVPSKIGALCFACVIHQKHTSEAYRQVFLSMKATVENDFEKTIKPRSVVLHDSNEQILAIKAVFRDTKVMIAPWSVCRDFWTYMSSGNTLESICHTMMAVFHSIMHAADAKSAHLRFIKFVRSAEFTSLAESLRQYIEEVWKKYRLIVWWSSLNNNMIELSVTLLQQLFSQNCGSFNIVNMCDVINILDKHFQQIMIRWLTKKSVLKVHTRFLNNLSPEINTWTIKLLSPHEFLLTNESLQATVRTDTWCCNCAPGKRALYCKHQCAIMNLADVPIALTDNEKDVIKEIAGENCTTTDSDDIYDVDNVHPYSDGSYLFNFPIKVIQYNDKVTVEKESNDMLKKKSLEDIYIPYKQNNLLVDLEPKETVYREDTLDFTNVAGNGSQETIYIKAEQIDETEDVDDEAHMTYIGTNPVGITQEELLCIKGELIEEPMEIENANMQIFFNSQDLNYETINPIKEETTEIIMNIEKTEVEQTDLSEYKNLQDKKQTEESNHIKEEKIFLIEIEDITNPLNCYRPENVQSQAISNHELEEKARQTDIQNLNLKNNNLLVKLSQDVAVSENNFEAEYKNAMDSLSMEFKKLDDCFSLSPSGSKLASIMRLTKELSRSGMELQDIKSELKNSNNDT